MRLFFNIPVTYDMDNCSNNNFNWLFIHDLYLVDRMAREREFW